MQVLYVAAEAAPLVKVGGLGDVAGSLPPAIRRLGVDIRVAIPWHPEIDIGKWGLREVDGVGETWLGESGVPVYLLARDLFAKVGKHQAILKTKEEEGWYGGFCNSILDFIKRSDWKPEVFHGNDWHVAEALMRFEKADKNELREWGYERKNLATLLTVHNLNYHSKVLRKAILAADIINAVSPSYAQEILTPRFCAGLCKELRSRKQDLFGVLNGIDYKVWNPRNDSLLAANYGDRDYKDGKLRNKRYLQKLFGLALDDSLLLAFVGRLDPQQKGVRILVNAAERIIGLGCQIIVLGTGDPGVEKEMLTNCKRNGNRMGCALRYDEELAHRIYAGADALLIPSRYEPCGLIQMIGMKYGTLPIAHTVGGLKDTVKDGRTGFLYSDYYARGLVRSVSRANNIYTSGGFGWKKMVEAAMNEDFSWDRSALEYIKLYEKALEKSRMTSENSDEKAE